MKNLYDLKWSTNTISEPPPLPPPPPWQNLPADLENCCLGDILIQFTLITNNWLLFYDVVGLTL